MTTFPAPERDQRSVSLPTNGSSPFSSPLARTSVPDFLAGGGEMGERIRAFDWASTPLGAVEGWPQSLKTVVRIMLTSRQPIWIGWGPELIKLYNDPYKAIVGGKHPEALGQPASVVWRDIWGDVGPRLQATLESNEGTYDESLLLIMERYGYPEETYYTFSYSPVPGDEGGVGGIICANTDDTARVIGERQSTLLRTLAAQTTDVHSIEEACRKSLLSLEADPADLPFALLYLLDMSTHEVRLAGTAGISPTHPAAFPTLSLDASALWPVATVLREQQPCLVAPLPQVGQAFPSGPWQQSVTQAVALPIAPAGQSGQAGMLIVGLNPLRLFDENYQGFLKLVAGQIAASVAHAQAYEEERTRAQALEEMDRVKTLFFSNISHELRTPLTLMLGPIEDTLEEAEALSPALSERVHILHRNALRLLKLVNTLLDFSRLEAGRVQAMYEPTDLAQFSADLASSFRSVIEKAGMILTVDCPPLETPVYVDRQMWEKIVLNLVSNAFKYTLAGEITVRLRATPSTIEFSVSDTGVGIPADELPHLFERFHRIAGTAGRSIEGTGIGLSLVQELVKLHGGSIAVNSQPGVGSTFTVALPLGNAHLPAEQLASPRSLASTQLDTRAYLQEALGLLGEQELAVSRVPDSLPDRGKHLPEEMVQEMPARILFADDNADMRAYVSRLLRAQYAVETVADGRAALEHAQASHPDLILTDVMMPGMDGFELLNALRADPRTRTIPIILLSARAGEEAKVEGLQAGADDYLTKPFSARELLARIEARLEIERLRKETEKRVQAERQRLFDLFMQAPSAIAIVQGPMHVFELVNPLAMQIMGIHRSVVGKSVREALPEIEGQGFITLLDGVYQTGKPFLGNEISLQLDRHGNGVLEQMYVNFVYQPSYNASGEIDGVLIYTNDVTEQVVARHTIEESEERFRTLANNISQFAWMADATGWIFWFNQRWYDYTGTTFEAMQGWGWSSVPHPEHVERVLKKIRHSFATGEVWEDTFPLRGTDGSYRWFLSRAVPIRNEQGQILRWFGTNTDVTEQQQLQQQKDEFLGIASHELKTPVTSLKGYTQLLQRQFRRAGDERTTMLLGKMDAQVNKLTALITDLLDVTKIESGHLLFQFTSFDWNTLVREIIEEVQRTTSKQTIRQELAPSVTLLADRDRLGQVLTNLLTNAIKYAPDARTILVKTALSETEILTSVQDFGIGIPKENQAHVFERFFRVEGENQATYPGLGLGLYISAEFVKRHEGRIWVESEPGEGTTMTFALPLPKPADQDVS